MLEFVGCNGMVGSLGQGFLGLGLWDSGSGVGVAGYQCFRVRPPSILCGTGTMPILSERCNFYNGYASSPW